MLEECYSEVVSFTGLLQLKCDLDVDIRLRTAFVVLFVSAAPRTDHTIAVVVVGGQVNGRTTLDQVDLLPVVRPHTEPVRITQC